jgi:hypothetical protein
LIGDPLKSEDAAFKWLLVVLAVAVTIGVIVTLVRALT